MVLGGLGGPPNIEWKEWGQEEKEPRSEMARWYRTYNVKAPRG